MCACCSCYPYEEDDGELVDYVDELVQHPYLVPPAASDHSTKSKAAQRQQDATSNSQEV
jgi:hypothetical protein